MLEDISLKFLHYVAMLHLIGFFHGDIKPENFFHSGDYNPLSSDNGSLIFVKDAIKDNSEPQFYVTQATPGVCSPYHFNEAMVK
jgi:serine/threonine protein kinase